MINTKKGLRQVIAEINECLYAGDTIHDAVGFVSPDFCVIYRYEEEFWFARQSFNRQSFDASEMNELAIRCKINELLSSSLKHVFHNVVSIHVSTDPDSNEVYVDVSNPSWVLNIERMAASILKKHESYQETARRFAIVTGYLELPVMPSITKMTDYLEELQEITDILLDMHPTWNLSHLSRKTTTGEVSAHSTRGETRKIGVSLAPSL